MNPVVLDVLIGDDESALIAFPISAGQDALQLGLMVQDRDAVKMLVKWYENFCRAPGGGTLLRGPKDLTEIAQNGSIEAWAAGTQSPTKEGGEQTEPSGHLGAVGGWFSSRWPRRKSAGKA
jgi:hypothetical protein